MAFVLREEKVSFLFLLPPGLSSRLAICLALFNGRSAAVVRSETRSIKVETFVDCKDMKDRDPTKQSWGELMKLLYFFICVYLIITREPSANESLWIDNHMINGTKLLNVVGMTRGRRDGILKAEKQKQVVKVGPMHLKGVWYISYPSQKSISKSNRANPRIPYERALALANQEKITEKLYPLFVHNIGALLYHPSNAARPLPLPPTYQQRPDQQAQAVGAEEDDRRPRLWLRFGTYCCDGGLDMCAMEQRQTEMVNGGWFWLMRRFDDNDFHDTTSFCLQRPEAKRSPFVARRKWKLRERHMEWQKLQEEERLKNYCNLTFDILFKAQYFPSSTNCQLLLPFEWILWLPKNTWMMTWFYLFVLWKFVATSLIYPPWELSLPW
jgi:hypothetical protein